MRDFTRTAKLVATALLLFGAGNNYAATASASFDFGTGPGKVTADSSGFALTAPPPGSADHSPDALVLTARRPQFNSFGFFQGFVGMRASDGYDFIVTMKTAVEAFAGSNNRRWGIHLFGSDDLAEEGLCAIVIGNNKDLRSRRIRVTSL